MHETISDFCLEKTRQAWLLPYVYALIICSTEMSVACKNQYVNFFGRQGIGGEPEHLRVRGRNV